MPSQPLFRWKVGGRGWWNVPSVILFNRPPAPGTILGRLLHNRLAGCILLCSPLRLFSHLGSCRCRGPFLGSSVLGFHSLGLRPGRFLSPRHRLRLNQGFLFLHQTESKPRVGCLHLTAATFLSLPLTVHTLVLDLKGAAKVFRVGEKTVKLVTAHRLVPRHVVPEAILAATSHAGDDGGAIGSVVHLARAATGAGTAEPDRRAEQRHR